jgi:hypothetical protein
VVLVEIFANRPIANDIGHAQHDLRVAQAGAERSFRQTGSYAGANAVGLEQSSDGELEYVGPDEASDGLGSVSVLATSEVWAAAVQIRPGACFYLKLVAGAADPRYGVGTECTATNALGAGDDRW